MDDGFTDGKIQKLKCNFGFIQNLRDEYNYNQFHQSLSNEIFQISMVSLCQKLRTKQEILNICNFKIWGYHKFGDITDLSISQICTFWNLKIPLKFAFWTFEFSLMYI